VVSQTVPVGVATIGRVELEILGALWDEIA